MYTICTPVGVHNIKHYNYKISLRCCPIKYGMEVGPTIDGLHTYTGPTIACVYSVTTKFYSLVTGM